MAVAQAYGKTVTSGSVFAYDTGDTVNSYKGKPGYNVTGTPVAWVGNNNTSDFRTTVGTTRVNIPAIGDREVSFVNIFNTGASNCCPSLWRYGDWGIVTGVGGNILYTYSIIYKTISGYTHPNFMYRYEFNGGNYITEVGIFDTAKRIDLGDGWYQAYNTFTTNASTNTLYLGMFYYQYNVQDTVYLYKASLTQGNHVFPPEQFIPPSTIRPETQGLLPLVGNSTLNLSNVSFDTNAQMTFDGTNDSITTENLSSYFPTEGSRKITQEYIIRFDSSYTGGWQVFNQGPAGFYTAKIVGGGDNGKLIIMLSSGGGNYWHYSTSTLPDNIYHHVVFTMEEDSNSKWYINGVLDNTVNLSSYRFNSPGTVKLGTGFDNSTWFRGQIPVAKVYNRALSAAEVRQNYQHYKTRFNLN